MQWYKKRKIIIVGDLLLNDVNEKGLSKNHSVKVNTIPDGTSDTILDKLDDFLRNKLDGPCRCERHNQGEKSTE